jgi:hypothetical protein
MPHRDLDGKMMMLPHRNCRCRHRRTGVDGAPVAIRGSRHEELTTAAGAPARCAPPGVGAPITIEKDPAHPSRWSSLTSPFCCAASK